MKLFSSPRMPVLLLSLAAGAGILACTTESDPQPLTAPATLMGRLMDSVGRPVSAARVTILTASGQPTGWTAVVGPKGDFMLNEVPVRSLRRRGAQVRFEPPVVDLPPVGDPAGDYAPELVVPLTELVTARLSDGVEMVRAETAELPVNDWQG